MASGAALHDREAEAYELEVSLIAQLIQEPRNCDLARDAVRADHFASGDTRWLFETIMEWQATGQPITFPVLMKRYGEVVRDARWREALIDALGSYHALLPDFGQTIAAVRRMGDVRLIQDALTRLANMPCDDPKFLASEIERVAGPHAIASDDRDYSHTAGQSAEAVIERAKAARNGAPLGVECFFLPEIEPMAPTDLIVLAGRPAMGKSALGGNIARAASESGVGTVLFSLEMSHDQFAARMMAEMSRESAHPCTADQIKKGNLTVAQFEVLEQCRRALERRPLYIHDRGGQSLAQIRHWTRAYRAALEARGSTLGLVIVDYLQLIVNPKSKGDRVGDTTLVSKGLKEIAKEFRVPVLALSQLTRACEQREDKRPQLSDLRDSGSIEQDADTVLFVYRDEYYHAKTRAKPGHEAEWESRLQAVKGKAELIRAKNRHGRIGNDELIWDGDYQAFRSPRLVR